ncbi:MAG: alkaline phosphatase family protein [Planctomycetes bacterium]|nr:alkaline phosphatase family protein [Planctomycetota bacterium]
MDPRLCGRLMDAGLLPNMARLRESGGFKPLGTSIPPQSPVAWSNFITGAGPGAHGIFDFIHRDPARQYSPYYSAAETKTSEEGWEVGAYRLPLTFWPFHHNPTQTLLKRGGTPFWDHLDAAGVTVRIYDIPANYPPSPSKHGHMCCLSGMGVPDLLGTYGTYQHFAEDTFRVIDEGGGIKKPIVFRGNVAKAKLSGPDHTYLKKPRMVAVDFEVFRHPEKPAARIELQNQTIVLNEGEWSDWQKVDYRLEMPPFLPDEHAKGICRFYLQEVRPNFRLYVTPINIDPSDPSGQLVSEPESFVEEIAEDIGLFYTAGFQEDHKALSQKVFRMPNTWRRRSMYSKSG